jgi:plastocyanin
MTRRALPLLLVLASFLLVLAGCGGGGSSSTSAATTPAATGGGGGGSTVNISADPSGAFKYEQTQVTAKAGSVTIDFTNMSSIGHDVKVEGNGVEDEGTDIITSSSTTATLDLQPGTYTFFCSVDSHRQAGMEGKLIVQ